MLRTGRNTVTKACIVEAAVLLFAEHGYAGASTIDISSFAKINEVTLYRYFPSKKKLFVAAIESRLSTVRMSRELQYSLASDAELQVVVPMLTKFVLEKISDQPELLRLLFVANVEMNLGDRMMREHLGPIFDAVNAYFMRCADRGHISDVDASMAALSLTGIMGAHQHLYQSFTGAALGWGSEQAASVYSDFLLRALGSSKSRSSKPKTS